MNPAHPQPTAVAPPLERKADASAWGRPGARTAYTIAAWAFVAAVVVQVFLAGLAVTTDASYWSAHTTFVHVFELVPLLMALLAWQGRAPRRLIWLPVAAFGLIWLQYMLINLPIGLLRAAHPTNALAIFALALSIALQARASRRAAPVAVMLVMALLAGCVGDATTPEEPTVPEQDAQGRYVIHVGTHGSTFTPKHAQVPVGAAVIWVNDQGMHDVTADDGSFTSGAPKNGDWTYEHTFTTAGDYRYHCTPHKGIGMAGTVTVVEG